MPTQKEVAALRTALAEAGEGALVAALKRANYRIKKRDAPIKARSGRTVHISEPTTIDKYIEITGFSVDEIRSEVIVDVCEAAFRNKDQFYSVYRAMGLPPDERAEAALEAITQDTTHIVGNTKRTADSLSKPWYRDRKWLIGMVVAVVALSVGIWRLYLAIAGA